MYTGPCFSNAETFVYGNRAVMAWKVTEGSWKGVDLRGLCVAAAVSGNTTFSEDDPAKARPCLIVDSRADPTGSASALIDLAKTLGGARLDHVAAVTDRPNEPEAGRTRLPAARLEPTRLTGCRNRRRASFWAAGLAQHRHPSSRRARPRLRQRSRRLSSPLRRGDGPAGLYSRPRIQGRWTRQCAGTIPTAAAASWATFASDQDDERDSVAFG